MNAGPSHGWITERRVRALLEATGQFHYRLSADGTVIRSLAGPGIVEDMTGPLEDLLLGQLPPEDRPLVREAVAAAVRERRPFDVEHRVLRPDGSTGWIRSRAVPLLGPDGEIEEWLGAAEDVTARRDAEERLREREERLRLAIEIAELSTWDWDLATDEVAWSPGHFRLYGYAPDRTAPSYAAWAARVHPEDLPQAEARIAAARAAGVPYRAEFRVLPAPEELRWHRAFGCFLYDAEGRPRRLIGVLQDITAQKEAEGRQRFLLAEIQRRLRNTLAVVRSIVRRSMRSATGIEGFASHLEGRIDALARVESAIARAPEAGPDLEALLRDELQAAVAGEGQLRLSGPSVRLPARAAELLALAFHELATNAIKFGALAGSGGSIAVSWSVEGTGPPRLRLLWRETCPRAAVPLRRRGFGTEFLERTLPYSLGAETRIDRGAEGIACEIVLPLGPAPG